MKLDPKAHANYLQIAINQRKRQREQFLKQFGPGEVVNSVDLEIVTLQEAINDLIKAAAAAPKTK